MGAAIGHALSMAGSMTWQILWALILGFALSAVVQAVVRRSTIVRRAGRRPAAHARRPPGSAPRPRPAPTPRWRWRARCSARARSFTAAMAFEIASTNLVVELGVILALLMGWQFTLAEFVGGPVMIVVLAVLFRLVLTSRARGRGPVEQAHAQAERGLAGSMEGHAAMDMSVQGEGSLWRRLFSRDALTSVSHVFVMEWAAIWRDLVDRAAGGGRDRRRGCPTRSGSDVLPRGPSHDRRRCGARSIGPLVAVSASSARSATCRWPSCCGTAGSASAAWSPSSSPT